MMKKISMLMAVCLLFGMSMQAQKSEEDLNPKDPKAQEILDALSNKAKEYKSFSADFE